MKPKDLVIWAVIVLLVGAPVLIVWLHYATMSDGDLRPSLARLDVLSLDQAAAVYYLENHQYPPDLETLTKPRPDGKPAIIKGASLLIDPWGRPYQYDPKQLNPKTEKPLIWCVPDSSKPEIKVTNWD